MKKAQTKAVRKTKLSPPRSAHNGEGVANEPWVVFYTGDVNGPLLRHEPGKPIAQLPRRRRKVTVATT